MRNPVCLSVLVACFLLGACSSTEWAHRYKKQEEFLYDYNKCDRAVTEQSNNQAMPFGAYQQSIRVDQCLQKEGWRKVRR